MIPVVLGDLLQLAASALSEAAAGPGIGERPDRRELAATLLQAHRLAAAMARFADDVADEGVMAADRGPLTNAWTQAADDTRSALRHAEENLAHVTGYFGAAIRSRSMRWPATSAKRPGSSPPAGTCCRPTSRVARRRQPGQPRSARPG
jgi:hypothetical protein